MRATIYTRFGKRCFDLLASMLLIIISLPFLLVIALLISLSSKGAPIILLKRVGMKGKEFRLFKLRTMFKHSDNELLTISVGSKDKRITKIGYWLRKRKIDEIPQLLNVLMGEMSFVGPRPLVKEEIELYAKNYEPLLQVKPGLTDPASIKYFDENDLLSTKPNPITYYNQIILPEKIALSYSYLSKISFTNDLALIFKTIKQVWKSF